MIYSHGNVHVWFAVLTRWHENVCVSACGVRACLGAFLLLLLLLCVCVCVCVCVGVHWHSTE